MKSRHQLDVEFLGQAAVDAIERLVAEEPPFTPEQRDAIAVLLGHPRTADGGKVPGGLPASAK